MFEARAALEELKGIYADAQDAGKYGDPSKDPEAANVHQLIVRMEKELNKTIPEGQKHRHRNAIRFLSGFNPFRVSRRPASDSNLKMSKREVQQLLVKALQKAKISTQSRRKYQHLCNIVNKNELPGKGRERPYDRYHRSIPGVQDLHRPEYRDTGVGLAFCTLAKNVFDTEVELELNENSDELNYEAQRTCLCIIEVVEAMGRNMKDEPFDGVEQMAIIDSTRALFTTFLFTLENLKNPDIPKEVSFEKLSTQRQLSHEFLRKIEKLGFRQEMWHKKFMDRQQMADNRLAAPLEQYGIANRNNLDYDKALHILCNVHEIPVVSEGFQPRLDSKDGGSAQVQKINTPQNQMVAVKIPRPGLPSSMDWRICLRIIREASTWWKLRHANILDFQGIWKGLASHAPIGLVSPWCDATLAEYVQDLPTHPDVQSEEKLLYRKLQLLLDVAQGLQYLHSQEPVVIHADLKAANVLVHDDRAVLCDFGISDSNDTKTNGVWTGMNYTVSWTAPEILRWRSFHTTQTDMYAFGCVFLEVITGNHPYCAEELVEDVVMNIRLNKTPDNFPPFQSVNGQGITPQHGEFMKRCWSIAVEERPSADKSVEQLQKFVAIASQSQEPN